jgi:hypothetical protein
MPVLSVGAGDMLELKSWLLLEETLLVLRIFDGVFGRCSLLYMAIGSN